MSENEIQPQSEASNPFEKCPHKSVRTGWLVMKATNSSTIVGGIPDFPAMFHPYPLKIDSAASAMSDKYNVRIEYQKDRKEPWLLNFWKSGEAFPKITRVTGPDEITVRMRAAVLTRSLENVE